MMAAWSGYFPALTETVEVSALACDPAKSEMDIFGYCVSTTQIIGVALGLIFFSMILRR